MSSFVCCHRGAAIKQLIRRAILHNKIRTRSKYITSSAEVAEHLRNHFATEEWRKKHVNAAGVNEARAPALHPLWMPLPTATPTGAPVPVQVVVLYSDATDMEGERNTIDKYKFDSLKGQMSTFSYMPLGTGVVAGREGSCWCPPCFGARGRGAGTADSNLCVEGCRCDTANPWREQEVQRGDALGIAERRVVAQREGKRVAKLITPAMCVQP